MNNSALFEQIIEKLRTTSEATSVIHCLEELSATSFEQTSSPQIFKNLPKEIADILISIVTKPATQAEQIALKRELNELQTKLHACKSIRLTIAFQPDDTTLSFFSDWIKKNVRPDLLIDLQFDKSIVGGMQLIYGGVYKDFTVKKNLTNRFQIQRDEIIKLLE